MPFMWTSIRILVKTLKTEKERSALCFRWDLPQRRHRAQELLSFVTNPSLHTSLNLHHLTPTDEVFVSRSVSLMWQQKESDPEQTCPGELGGSRAASVTDLIRNVLFLIIRDISPEWQAGKVRGKMVKCERNINYLYWCSRNSTKNPEKQIRPCSKSIKHCQSM